VERAFGPDIDLFATRIRETRKLRRMSLQEVADASDFTKSHVWELEKGMSRNPTIRAVWSLARALCVSPAWLLGLDHEVVHLDPLAGQIAALINAELTRRTPIPAANPTGSLATGRDGAVCDPFHSINIA
jgi:transcriptional regulator with XRE-family HTH domain